MAAQLAFVVTTILRIQSRIVLTCLIACFSLQSDLLEDVLLQKGKGVVQFVVLADIDRLDGCQDGEEVGLENLLVLLVLQLADELVEVVPIIA